MVKSMIDFKRFSLNDKAIYEEYFKKDICVRGCEFSFSNMYLWGRQNFAELNGQIVMFSQFDRKTVYPFPIGDGDKRAVVDAIIADAKARGIPCRITGLCEGAKDYLDSVYPGKFRFHSDEGSFDYVYAIDDLADLQGKKYDGKRNHIARFKASCPVYTCEPINDENESTVIAMIDAWYSERLAKNPDADFHMERAALKKAIRDRDALEMESLVIKFEGEIMALTLGSFLTDDTLDVQFEKARTDVPGAYTVVNNEFARYIREKYPQVKYLDREEDMGLDGLRKAKKSYYPHHMIKKYWACLLEEGCEY